MTMTSNYFVGNQYLEHRALFDRVTASKVTDAERLHLLNSTIEHARAHSPFYRAATGWRTLKHADEMLTLPFTRKQDLQDGYPFGFLAVDPAQIVRYAESTGTAGRPSAGFVTRQDWLLNNLHVALSWAQVLAPGDALAVAVPYELTYVGADIDRVAELLQISVLSVGVNHALCPWNRVIELLRAYSVTALFCAPTRAIRLAQLARQAGLDPRRDLNVRKIICVGEPSSEAKRRYIERCWDAAVYNHYGMTETMAVAVPCAQRRLHLCEHRLHAEVLDPDTGEKAAPGSPGELVLTTLTNQAMPLLRYRTGDLVSLDSEPCGCGNAQQTIRQLGRVCDTFQTPSGPAYFHQLDEIILSEPALQPYHSVHEQGRELHVSVVRADGNGTPWDGSDAQLQTALQQRIAAHFGVVAQIHLKNQESWLQRIDTSSKPGSALGQPAYEVSRPQLRASATRSES